MRGLGTKFPKILLALVFIAAISAVGFFALKKPTLEFLMLGGPPENSTVSYPTPSDTVPPPVKKSDGSQVDNATLPTDKNIKKIETATPPTEKIDKLKSDFLKNNPVAQSISSGSFYQLSNSNFLVQGGSKINALSFEFKLINALKQLGFAQLTYSEIPGSSDATAAFYKWQRANGFGVSDILTKEKMILIDQQVYEMETKDREIAKVYPPYQKFAVAPSNEPSSEHLATIYSNLFSSLPKTVKATLWLAVREQNTYSTVFSLEEFPLFINRYGDPYFGALFNKAMERRLSSEELERMVGNKIYDFMFCGEGYYSRREIGNCLVLNSETLLGSIGSDIAHASTLAHEFGHGVGQHDMLINGETKYTTEHFGGISFDLSYPYPQNLNIPLRVENDGEFVSRYAKTNYLEDFAESFSAYIHSGNIFRKRAETNAYLKQKYNFLKENVFGGKEYNTGSLDSYYLWQSKKKSLPPYQDNYMQEDPNWVWDYKYEIKSR